jgi:hypothetical protein
MATRGRKQKACLLEWNLGEILETHLDGKATEKRQNFDPSTPPACAENLHFTLNGETRKATRLPDTHAWMAWEDTDKVSFDETTTKLHLHAEKLTGSVLHLHLGHFVGLCVCVCVQFCSTLYFPFDETTTEQHLRHHLQDWRLRDEHQNY